MAGAEEAAGVASSARLDPASLCRAAADATGLADFGPMDFLMPLDRLCQSANDEARLTEASRSGFMATIVNNLSRRLQIYADRARFSEMEGQEIAAPLVVVGLPRSGTTILHALLAQDPDVRSPQAWEIVFPSPPPRAGTYATDPRIAQSQAQIDSLDPEFRAMHAMGATLPDECNAIMTMAFLSPNFGAAFNVPGYVNWLIEEADMKPAFAFHRHFLQHHQMFSPGRFWVLKAPPYLWWLDELFDAYPDARVVFTHRDPAQIMASNASLIHYLRSKTYPVAKVALGREQSTQWGLGVTRAMAYRASGRNAARFLDTHYADFTRDPMSIVRQVYAHFGLDLGDRAVAAMIAFNAANQQGKHGRHVYDAADYGLEPAHIHAEFADYIARFNIPVSG